MAFLVEDGTGLPASNSFASVAEADTLVADRGGDAAWEALGNPVKQGWLVRATEYIVEKTIFLGTQKTSAQALSFPRTGAWDRDAGLEISDTIVPPKVKQATILLAVRGANGAELTPDIARGGGISSESVGPISVSYFESASADTLFPAMRLLKGLVRPDDPMYGVAPAMIESENTTDRYFTEGMFNRD